MTVVAGTDHEQFDYLDKADKTHAEKQVQMAADDGHELAPRLFGLFGDILVGERVVVERELDHVCGQIVAEVRLIGEAFEQHRVRFELLLHVELLRIGVERSIVVEAMRTTLERTLGHTVLGYVLAHAEHRVVELVGAVLLRAEAVAVAGYLIVDPVVGAVADRIHVDQVAEEQARVLSVGDVVRDDQVEERRVVDRMQQLIVAVHIALVVRVGPLVVAIVGVLGHSDVHGDAGRDSDRARRVFVQVLAVLCDHQVDAAIGDQRAYLVRNASIELNAELVVLAAVGVGLEQLDGVAVRVEARVELQAIESIAVEEASKRARVARLVPKRAANDEAVVVEHALFLLESEIRAGCLHLDVFERDQVVVGIGVECFSKIGRIQELNVIGCVQRILAAHGYHREIWPVLQVHAQNG